MEKKWFLSSSRLDTWFFSVVVVALLLFQVEKTKITTLVVQRWQQAKQQRKKGCILTFCTVLYQHQKLVVKIFASQS